MAVILKSDWNKKSLNNERKGLSLVRNEYKRFWNSEARFVVAGANEFSMPQLKYIFHYFSKLRIYNCVIVSPEQCVIDKEYGSQINANNVDNVLNFEDYTWFPYQGSDNCTEVNITL